LCSIYEWHLDNAVPGVRLICRRKISPKDYWVFARVRVLLESGVKASLVSMFFLKLPRFPAYSARIRVFLPNFIVLNVVLQRGVPLGTFKLRWQRVARVAPVAASRPVQLIPDKVP
jgi:hypothetical protein